MILPRGSFRFLLPKAAPLFRFLLYKLPILLKESEALGFGSKESMIARVRSGFKKDDAFWFKLVLGLTIWGRPSLVAVCGRVGKVC